MLLGRVEKTVRVETLSRCRDVRNSEVQRQDDNQPEGVNPQRGIRPGKDNLEKSEDAVEEVLRDVAPPVVDHGEPWRGVEDYPEDDGHEERVDDHGRVKDRVEGLQRPGEAIEERGAGPRVGEGVQGGEKEVESEAPVGDVGEVAEGVARGGALVWGVDALPG